MPMTPFHFGPGALLHSAAPRRVSFIAFAAANCITDIESIYNILRDSPPLHRFLHTFVGAALVAGFTVLLFVALRRLARTVNIPNGFHWQQLSFSAVAIGAALGSFSHIVLDGIMHADMHPFAPWSAQNPFLNVISLGALHVSCVAAGLVGLAIIYFRRADG